MVTFADNVGMLGPVTSSSTTARYFVWPAGASSTDPTQVLRASTGTNSYRKGAMAVAASVDPLDDSVFWTIQHYTGGRAVGTVFP